MDDPAIPAAFVARVLALAQAAPAEEVCGLLLGRGARIETLLPAANVAADCETTFEIDPAVLLAAHRAARAGGMAVLGCYHSHPRGDATPSVRDVAAAQAGQLWLIVAQGEARLWRFEPGGFVEIALEAAVASAGAGGQ